MGQGDSKARAAGGLRPDGCLFLWWTQQSLSWSRKRRSRRRQGCTFVRKVGLMIMTSLAAGDAGVCWRQEGCSRRRGGGHHGMRHSRRGIASAGLHAASASIGARAPEPDERRQSYLLSPGACDFLLGTMAERMHNTTICTNCEPAASGVASSMTVEGHVEYSVGASRPLRA